MFGTPMWMLQLVQIPWSLLDHTINACKYRRHQQREKVKAFVMKQMELKIEPWNPVACTTSIVDRLSKRACWWQYLSPDRPSTYATYKNSRLSKYRKMESGSVSSCYKGKSDNIASKYDMHIVMLSRTYFFDQVK